MTTCAALWYIMRAAEESGEKIKPGRSPKELKKHENIKRIKNEPPNLA